jgi:hypothetical protein
MKRFFVFCLSFWVFNTFGQRSSGGISWNISNTTGSTKSFIDKTSFSGGSLDFTYYPVNNLGFFIEGGVNYFSQKIERATYIESSISITGVQFRELMNIPIFIGAQFDFLPESIINPYCNLGFGTMYQRGTITMGLFIIDEDLWQFAYKPEAGLKIMFNENLSGKLGAKYIRTFESGGLESQSFWALNFGLAFEVEY